EDPVVPINVGIDRRELIDEIRLIPRGPAENVDDAGLLLRGEPPEGDRRGHLVPHNEPAQDWRPPGPDQSGNESDAAHGPVPERADGCGVCAGESTAASRRATSGNA